jgi:hypothetical protein
MMRHHRGDLPKAITEGILEIGDLKLPCAVLDDASNTRVLSQNGGDWSASLCIRGHRISDRQLCTFFKAEELRIFYFQ